MSRKKDKVLRAAAETSHTAAQRGADVVEKAGDLISDYVDSLSPYVEKAGDKVGPLAHSAKVRGAAAAHQAVETLGPRLNDALEKVSPAVEVAQKKVQDDLLPRLSEVLERAAETDVAQTATRRGAATVAALKGELELPEPKRKRRWVRRLAVVAAVGGVAYVAFKKFFGPQDSGWETYQPSAPYAGSTTATATKVADTAAGSGTDSAGAGSTASTSTTAAPTTADDAVQAAATAPADPDTVAEKVDRIDPAGGEQGSTYGPGSYVGSEPPEGFAIKGNERSMKYHTPESGGYDRTIAEVWFADESAAEAAGFTKAQR